MFDSALIQQLDSVLNTSAVPHGCVVKAARIDQGLSFWEAIADVACQPSMRPRQLDPVALQQEVEQLRQIARATVCPIVAVSGMLNSGKSSLIAGFLSDAGRRRVLIGRGNEAGTHRFVVWLPESWRKDHALWNSVQEQISIAFGKRGELLSDDPVIAHQQYNGLPSSSSTVPESCSRLRLFEVPLIATDPMLDDLAIGLMDCPDVQSGSLNGVVADTAASESAIEFSDRLSRIADLRLRTLMSALRLASCFLLVVQSNSLRDQLVKSLLQGAHHTLPGVKLFLAVNQVPKRYSIADIAKEAAIHFAHPKLAGVYMAYDFRGPQANSILPTAPQQWLRTSSIAQENLPIFFQIRQDAASQSTRTLAAEDYLLSLGSQLDPGELLANLARTSLQRFATQLREHYKGLDHCISQLDDKSQRLREVIARALFRFAGQVTGGEQEVRLQISDEIIAQMKESLERTAPWWAKPSQVIGRWSSKLGKSAKNLGDKIPGIPALGRGMQHASDWVKAKIHRGEAASVMTAEELAHTLRQYDRYGDFPPATGDSSDALVLTARRIIDRFQGESHVQLPADQLDNFTRTIWRHMSVKQKIITGAAPATLVFAPIVAVIAMPFDFGTSHVLVFATAKELMLAGVASAGLLLMQGDQFPELAEGEAAWKQVSDLYALACDEFGLPRLAATLLPRLQVRNEQRQLLSSATKAMMNDHCLVGNLMQYQPQFDQRMKNLLTTIDSNLRDMQRNSDYR